VIARLTLSMPPCPEQKKYKLSDTKPIAYF